MYCIKLQLVHSDSATPYHRDNGAIMLGYSNGRVTVTDSATSYHRDNGPSPFRSIVSPFYCTYCHCTYWSLHSLHSLKWCFIAILTLFAMLPVLTLLLTELAVGSSDTWLKLLSGQAFFAGWSLQVGFHLVVVVLR